MLRSWKNPKSIDVEEEEKIYIYENYKGGFFALLLFFFFFVLQALPLEIIRKWMLCIKVFMLTDTARLFGSATNFLWIPWREYTQSIDKWNTHSQ